MFQDDLGKLSPNISSAQEANRKKEIVIGKKLLSFNQEKSYCMVIGPEKARRKLLKELEDNPRMLSVKTMKLVNNIKYLGDQVCSSLAQSVNLTVKKC